MHNEKEINQLLTNEALRCRLAYEVFIRILEKEISSDLQGESVAWALIQDRYVAWISHLYEFLKACYAKDMSTHVDKIDEEICKRHGVNKRDTINLLILELMSMECWQLKPLEDTTWTEKSFFLKGLASQ
ncbi:hypothetical protein A8U91_01362 [Halomonas elongata]|uniref:Uncharacterized protein n=1 Tax=Halomonas elongata TaxID=2746 RepID=A0A1B8P413_HALEL|nr:hypothetical protein [Halomonas elongata]OBX37014.1 hypothetical protein A8U91_01362 [Halomonas elongata]